MYIHMYLLGRDVFHHESLRLRDNHKCEFPTFYILPQQHNNSKYFLHCCTKSQYWKKNILTMSNVYYDTMELSLFDIVSMIFLIPTLGVDAKYKI